MPHINLEYSSNIYPPIDFDTLFDGIHHLLKDLCNAQIEACKSRATKCSEYYIGDGQAEHAFVHVSIQMLPGRTDQQKTQLGQKIVSLLKESFESNYTMHFSVNVSELSSTFCKEIS